MDACNVANVSIVCLARMKLLMLSSHAYVAILAITLHILHLPVYFKKYHFEILNKPHLGVGCVCLAEQYLASYSLEWL